VKLKRETPHNKGSVKARERSSGNSFYLGLMKERGTTNGGGVKEKGSGSEFCHRRIIGGRKKQREDNEMGRDEKKTWGEGMRNVITLDSLP